MFQGVTFCICGSDERPGIDLMPMLSKISDDRAAKDTFDDENAVSGAQISARTTIRAAQPPQARERHAAAAERRQAWQGWRGHHQDCRSQRGTAEELQPLS